MSHIGFTTGAQTRLISGTERAHMGMLVDGLGGLVRPRGTADDEDRWFIAQLNAAMMATPDDIRLVARMHAQCELGAWVRNENTPWLARLIRDSCERTIRFKDQREQLLRVGFSVYGRADLNYRGDQRGPEQTWWSLCEWLENYPGDVAMFYSVSGFPWPTVQDRCSVYLDKWLRENVPHLEWTPEGWNSWEAR